MTFVAFMIALSMYIWPPQVVKHKLKIDEEIEELVEAQIELEEPLGK